MIQQFSLPFPDDLQPRYNIAPTQEVPVIRLNKDSERELASIRWGLIPFWAKESSRGKPLINARGETVATTPSFRQAFRKRRCLVLADGYYEWRQLGKQKQPYFIRLQQERPFAMAGLWECWRGANRDAATALESCTIVTTRSNELTSEVHDRMPVILKPADYEQWLDTRHHESTDLSQLMQPYESSEMTMDSVSTRVNSVRNDDSDCIARQRLLF